MTHHVVEHSAALQASLPEPRHVWTAVLLCRAREIRASRQRSATRPDQLLAAGDVRCEQLVLQVPGGESDALGQTCELLRLGHVPAEGLLTGDSFQLADAIPDRAHDLLHVRNARVVRAAQPQRIDRGISHHLADRLEGTRVSDFQLPRQLRGGSSVFEIRAPDAGNIRVPESDEGLNMKAGVESAPYEPNAQSITTHSCCLVVECLLEEESAAAACGRISRK